VRQVLIESRIVVANREFSRNLGVNANVADAGAIESPDGGNILTNTGFSVALPAANAAGILSTALLGDTFNLDLALSALESENNGEVISSPRVITANAAEASIQQGVEIPFLEAASSGAATVSFKEAVLSLTVTPQITPDERVIMDLFVTQDTQGQAVNVQGGGLVPSINTRSLRTQVLVDDGETVVLGGIYEQEDRDNINRVPVLGEIPLIGALFRNTTKQRDKRELLLFVTPKILKQGLTLN
jgi:type IV pilus assembly protein PilQ